MKLYKLLPYVFLIGMPMMMNAQKKEQKPEETVAQLTWGNKETVSVKGPYSLQWISNLVTYRDRSTVQYYNPEKNESGILITASDLTTKVGLNIKVGNFFPLYQTIGKGHQYIRFDAGGINYVIDPVAKKIITSFKTKTSYPVGSLISPDLKHLACIEKNNLYIYPQLNNNDTAHLVPVQITKDGSETIVYGQSVSQNEWGINGGLFWNPNGDKLAFYRMDQSMIPPYPIPQISETKELHTVNQYYPMAGGPNQKVTLGIYNLKTKKLIYLENTNPQKKFLTNIAWDPSGDKVYIAEVNRNQDTCKLNVYNAISGKLIKTLFTETDKKYVEPLYPIQFVPNHPNEFIWVSRRDGWRQLYLYNTEGKLIKQLTKGCWEVEKLLGFSPNGKVFYYTSTEISPLDRNPYGVNILTGQKICLNKIPGFHYTSISPNGNYFLDTYESIKIPRIDIVGLTKNAQVIKEINKSDNPDDQFTMPSIKLGTIMAADNHTKLYYKMILPPHFDKNKKYPAIVYVYNGPHAQMVQNRFHAGTMPWSFIAANNGYIVFTVDGRGSDARGAAFEQVIHRHLGVNEMADQMKGVDFLKSLPYVNPNRLGVYGWSFGGFMAVNLMLTHPDIFKVGVAGGPVMNWRFYEVMYGERYMDTPKENPQGYRDANLLLRAGNLKGRLLIIHGTNDPVVMWQHSLAFLKSCVHNNTYPDYMVYPGHLHNVIGPDRVHLNNKIMRYFKDFL